MQIHKIYLIYLIIFDFNFKFLINFFHLFIYNFKVIYII